MGVRRVLSLIAGLPPGSALHRSVDPHGAGAGWGMQEELLATVAEVIDYGNRLFHRANTKQNAKQPNPLFIPRPYRPKPRKATSADLRNLMKQRGIHVVQTEKGAS